MLTRTFAAAAVVLFAGSAFAADAPKPPMKVVPIVAPGPVLAGDIAISIGAFGGDGRSYGIFDALGRVNKPLNQPGWNLETEIFGSAIFEGGESAAAVGPAMHLWGMHGPGAAMGVYGGVAFAGYNFWTVGAEAKHFTASGSWGGSAGVVGCFGGCSFPTLGAFTANLNHYFNPNHRLGLQAAVLTDFSSSFWEIKADVEHRFAHPISLFGSVSYAGGEGSNFWTGKVGLRFFLDGPTDTLQSHEKKVPWTLWTPETLLAART